ncbi:hypothetical protein [Acinetobacter rudis]|uniref:Uncharacterized protein n=1 Tax=Acinetobacter rudis CIP 110305 TaxID=421052 RepID=S3N4D3_9GAMM|nr:hypothetical protein F945_01429 [Acinetobacter rudis CIP 110305]
MNICLGGPWHGSKILKDNNEDELYFKARDKSGALITYNKTEIKLGSRLHVFWVESTLTFQQTNDLLNSTLRTFR